MASGVERGARGSVDPTQWSARLAAVVAPELSAALAEIAEGVHEMFPVDVVDVHVVDETDAGIVTHGYRVGPSRAARALAPLLTPEGLDPPSASPVSPIGNAPCFLSTTSRRATTGRRDSTTC